MSQLMSLGKSWDKREKEKWGESYRKREKRDRISLRENEKFERESKRVRERCQRITKRREKIKIIQGSQIGTLIVSQFSQCNNDVIKPNQVLLSQGEL